ncbi:MAG: flagellar assembly protein A, partial [Planctomycetota bacterium]
MNTPEADQPKPVEIVEQARTVLFKEESNLSIFVCEISADAMTAWLRVEAGEGANLSVELVQELLHRHDLSYGLDIGALADLCVRSSESAGLYEARVATGTPVIQGTDAYIEYHKYPSGQAYRQKRCRADADEAIDYKEVPAFDNVRAGDLVGTYHPPVEGEGGTDVLGRVTPSRQVLDHQLRAGAGIAWNPEAGVYTATASGHLVLRNEMLSINDVYEVKENVDLSHGNIRFLGRVMVARDVQDDFLVEAEKGISVG